MKTGFENQSDIKVSVLMITYNHEPFIAQAIESVLAQKTSFTYELVIGEDCSTDCTREIVLSFQERYRDKIRALLSERNLGAHENFAKTFRACRGKYIAILEGDDYWTSPEKLQKQADFLDSHPECAICFTNAGLFFQDGERPTENACPSDQKPISTLEDLLAANFIPTCSCFFRNGLFNELPAWFHALSMGDWPLHILNAQHGAIGYIDDVAAVYRVHPGGTWYGARHNLLKSNLATIPLYESLVEHLGDAYGKTVRRYWARLVCATAHLYLAENDMAGARQWTQRLFSVRGAWRLASFLSLTKLLTKLYVPGVWGMAKRTRAAREGSSSNSVSSATKSLG